MLESAIDHLTSFPNSGIMNVFTVYPGNDRKIPGSDNVFLFNGTPLNIVLKIIPCTILYQLLKFIPHIEKLFGKDIEALVKTDVVLLIGGTTFSDAQLLKVVYNVVCALLAIILNKKSMMYSQTIGPFNKALNRAFAKFTLRRIDFIVPRGKGSYDNLKRLGISKMEYYTDAAFSLKIPNSVKSDIHNKYSRITSGKHPVIGISINTIVENKTTTAGINHNQIWADFISYLQDRNYYILLIPHSLREKTKSKHNNDLMTIDEIIKKLKTKTNIEVIRDPYNCKELREIVGLCEYYVASRFHSMISALCNKIPVLVIGWGFQKYFEVMEEFELEKYCNDAKDLKLELLIDGFEEIVKMEDEIKVKISRHLERIQMSSNMNHQKAMELYTGNHN